MIQIALDSSSRVHLSPQPRSSPLNPPFNQYNGRQSHKLCPTTAQAPYQTRFLPMSILISRSERGAAMMIRTISRPHKAGEKRRTEQRMVIPNSFSALNHTIDTSTRQRAFRERKERHVKDLEVKLKSIEARSTDLMSDNERLKRELDRLSTQNEILRATSTPMMKLSHQENAQTQRASSASPARKVLSSGPMIYSPSTFNSAFSDNGDGPVSHRIQISAQTGERLLATGAAWELIQSHELYRRGLVDIGEVSDRLKDKVLCDGSGPTFAESEVIKAIEESVGAAGDELI